MNKNTRYVGGINAIELLTIVFIILKLLHVITWSWFVVFLPMICFISISIMVAMVIIMFEKRGGRL